MVTFLKLFPESTDISSDEIVQDTKFNKKQNSKNQVQNEFHAKNLRSPLQYGSKDASTIHPQSQQTPLHSESILKINSESKISIQLISKKSFVPDSSDKSYKRRAFSTTKIKARSRIPLHRERLDTKENFRRKHNKSSGLLLGIVLIFLFCNLPRFLVKTFIITSEGKGLFEHYSYCLRSDRLHVPALISILGKPTKNL